MSNVRTATDTFGPIEVAADRYWGAQAQLALGNGKIGWEKQPVPIVRALGIVKRAKLVQHHVISREELSVREHMSIVLRNLLPYLVSVIMLRMALTIPAAIGSEVFITYIGLGLSVETPSLGNLVNDGRKVMMQAGLRYQLPYPTLILSFVTFAFYLIGNAFSDAADPKNHLQ